jgi:putative phage-type endonuclease
MERMEFLQRRKQGIGGSDVAAIAGLSPWRSPLDVYYDKLNIELGADRWEEMLPIGETAARYWGSVHESAIGKAYTAVTGRKIQHYNRLIVHPDKEYFIGDVDFLAYCEDGSRPAKPKGEIVTDKGIECKTSRYADDNWGTSFTDEIPMWYLTQNQWYMGLRPVLKSFDVPSLFCGSDFRIYTVWQASEVIERIQDIADDFWNNHLKKQIPPPPRSLEEVQRFYGTAKLGKTLMASQELEKDCLRYQEVSAARLALEKEEKELKDKIAVSMGDAEALTLPDDTILATFKEEKKGRMLRIRKNNNNKGR